MDYELLFLKSLFLAILSEFIVLLFLLRTFPFFFLTTTHHRLSKVVAAAIFSTSLTLPYFWFVLPHYIDNRFLYIGTGESSIILIESIFYHYFLDFRVSRSFLLSLSCNITSIIIGKILLN